MLRILIVVLAFLMLLGLGAYLFSARSTESAKVEAARAQVRVLDVAVKTYQVKNGNPPQTLEVLLQPDPAAGGSPYLENRQALLDPWGKQFQYAPEGLKNKTTGPAIWTTTRDGQMIGNWLEPKK